MDGDRANLADVEELQFIEHVAMKEEPAEEAAVEEAAVQEVQKKAVKKNTLK